MDNEQVYLYEPYSYQRASTERLTQWAFNGMLVLVCTSVDLWDGVLSGAIVHRHDKRQDAALPRPLSHS